MSIFLPSIVRSSNRSSRSSSSSSRHRRLPPTVPLPRPPLVASAPSPLSAVVAPGPARIRWRRGVAGEIRAAPSSSSSSSRGSFTPTAVAASSSPSARRQSRPRPTFSAMAAAAGSSGQIWPSPSRIRPVRAAPVVLHRRRLPSPPPGLPEPDPPCGGWISAMAARRRPAVARPPLVAAALLPLAGSSIGRRRGLPSPAMRLASPRASCLRLVGVLPPLLLCWLQSSASSSVAPPSSRRAPPPAPVLTAASAPLPTLLQLCLPVMCGSNLGLQVCWGLILGCWRLD